MDGPEDNSRCFKTALLIAVYCLVAVVAQNNTTTSTATDTSSDVTPTTMPTTAQSTVDVEAPTSTTGSSTTSPSTTNSPTSTSTTKPGMKIGETCEDNIQCVDNAECQNTTCTCTGDYYPMDDICHRRRPEGQFCSEDKECVENAECSLTGIPGSRKCRCYYEYYSAGSNCLQKVGLGENCTSENKCKSNAICNQTKLCTCQDGYFNYNGNCSETAKLNPKNIKATTGSKSATVMWEKPQQDCTLCRYFVTWTGNGSATNDTVTPTARKLTGLQPEVTYIITVQTLYVDSSGNAVKSKEMSVSVEIMESQVENLEVSNVTSSTAVVSFDEPQNETRDAFLLKFKNLTDSSSNCVFLIRDSTSYNMCDNYMKTKCNQSEQIAYDKHITYSVTNLMFYTNYSITVVMVTCDNGSDRESDPATQTITTKPEIPGKVRNLTAISNASHVCAFWLPPKVDSGPLEYHVQLMDNVRNTTYDPAKINDSKSSNIFCKKTSMLAGFWEYGFEVSAFTTESGEKKKSNIVITEVKKPIVNVTFVDADGKCCGYSCNPAAHHNYRKIQICWRDPEPRDRGTRLSHYVITVTNPTNNKKIHSITENVSPTLISVNDSTYRRSPSQPHDVSVDVIPGYRIKFETHDGSGNTYYQREHTWVAPTGKPPAWKQTVRLSVTESTEKSFTIEFPEPVFFLDNTNGRITDNDFLVSSFKTRLTRIVRSGVTDIRSTWKNNEDVHRVEIKTTNTDGRVTIGANSECSNTAPDVFCNGELQPDTSYYVVNFVCTSRGCVNSGEQGPFKTKDVDNTVTIAVALVGVALFVGVTVVVAAFLWRFRKSEHLPVTLSMRTKVDLSKIPRERPIPLNSMDERVSEMHSDSNRLFSMHYEDIVRVSPKHSTHAANVDENKQKNRWVNVLPFDDSRVKLSMVDDDETSDYINASYMPGYNWDKEYVASQGPLPGTVDDFWRMIWEKNVSMIVMVTPIKENGKVKCDEYWPVEVHEPKEYGNIVVENISFSSLNTYNVTIFQLRMGDEEEFRTVKHFHFLNWKDMSANVERSDVLNFVRTVRSYLRPDMEGPMIVHCSAGVGRTGTFICLDYFIQFIENHDLDETVDIYAFILKLRENRVLMVQTESQYVFLHDCANQLVEEKRQAMDNISENELLYVNTEIVASQSEDDEEKRLIYENTECASTSRLIQQTEL